MKLNRSEVDQRIENIKTTAPNFVTGDLIDTIDLLADRLDLGIHRAHQKRIDEVRRFVRTHYGARSAVDLFLIDIAAEAYQAGIYAASDSHYEPANARTAALLDQVRARLARTATPEGESLQRAVEG